MQINEYNQYRTNVRKNGIGGTSSMDLIIEKTRDINASKKVVWKVLTDPDSIRDWLGVHIETDWREDSPITFSFSWDGKNLTDKGHILKFMEPDTFSYDYWSWFSGTPDTPENYSIIAFRLFDNHDSTTLVLTHRNFSTPTMYEHSDKNWEETLDKIKLLAEKVIS
ncbi:SRPBCC domain-containing protein [Paenibacillus sp. BR1-192]|uniref:SRPBCC family protein n=1 Tax=Paenibacillus sp. BR1-192 TaxID=3032287 RepID=UPI00240CF3F4|nr:SRPBCC domain-containing protein [Paenibacillus sp. BR1-192]WFB55698.1 SRPBCC domain-containing protein [Paenibacillus sp. BR1-192]